VIVNPRYPEYNVGTPKINRTGGLLEVIHANRTNEATTGLFEYLTKNYGAATIANGTASIVVAHGLISTPESIRVTGTHTEVDLLYVDTVGVANFTIHAADGNTSSDRTVYWQADANI